MTNPLVRVLASLVLALLAALPASVRADDAGDGGFPIVYEGQGLRIEVAAIDAETARVTGTLVLGEVRMSFVAKPVETEDGGDEIAGEAQTKDGVRAFRAVEEAGDVVVVTFGGKTYRTQRVAKAKAEAPVKGGETKPAPKPADVATAEPSRPTPKPVGRVVLKQHVLTDKGMGDMKSHVVLAPDGWKVEGGAWWAAQSFFKILPSQDVVITAPDGRKVRLGPSLGLKDYLPSQYAASQLRATRPAEGTAAEGYLVLHLPTTPDEWRTFIAEKAVRSSFPAATDIDVRRVVVVPELTALLKKQMEPFQKMNADSNERSRSMGLQMFSFTDGSVFAASTTFADGGKKWEQLNVFGASWSGLDTQVGRQLTWAIEPNVSFLAPAGELDANLPLFTAISYSLRPTPEWARMRADHAAKMQQIDAKGAADRAKIWADANREISRTINEGYAARMASMDETQRRFVNMIRGVDDYASSSGEAVQLPSGYSYVFSNGNGDYVLTNEAGYDPNADRAGTGPTWEPMKPIER